MKGERRNADCADLVGVYAQQTQKIQIGIRSTGARSPTVTAISRAIGRIASNARQPPQCGLARPGCMDLIIRNTSSRPFHHNGSKRPPLHPQRPGGIASTPWRFEMSGSRMEPVRTGGFGHATRVNGSAKDAAGTNVRTAANRNGQVLAAVAFATLTLAAFAVNRPCAAEPRRADSSNTRGWQIMTPEERIAHQAKIRSFNDYSACRAYQADHHRRMEDRARQQGRTLAKEQRDACAHLEATLPAR